MLPERAGRLLRTVTPLRPSQVLHRGRLALRRALWTRLGDRPDARYRARAAALPAVRWNHTGLHRVASMRATARPAEEALRVATDALEGRFALLGEVRELGRPVAWQRADLDTVRLWKTQLHEFPFALDLAVAFRATGEVRFRRGLVDLAREWRAASPIGAPGFALEAWNARVVADRLIHWATAGALMDWKIGDADAAWLGHQIGIHALFLRDNLELDLLANHLFRDAVGLVFARELVGYPEDAMTWMEREIREQILDDGCHIERSPMYHALALQDLVELADLLDDRTPQWLSSAERRAAGFLAYLLHGDGDIPLFGDAWLGESEPRALLEASARHGAPLPPVAPENASGLVVRKRSAWHLVARAGEHGPRYQLGHAHADLLSFELSCGARRIVTDTGTGVYAPGPARDHLRSTAAHNTIAIDGQELLEAWSSFRSGRRGRARVRAHGALPQGAWLWAEHDGYAWLAGHPIHHRLWLLEDGGLWVFDAVTGEGEHRIESRLHLHPEASGELAEVAALGGGALPGESPFHERFNSTRPMPTRTVVESARLPWVGGWVVGPAARSAAGASVHRAGAGEAILWECAPFRLAWRIEGRSEDGVRISFR